MHIKKITIKNFKSFGKKVEIPLFRGFTAISGPNGSGKSNIIDSIVFCLGLTTSTKALRAEKLTDLVHNSNGRKIDSEEVEVSIVFDNSDSALPIDGDVTVTRKIRVTGKSYYSNYYLNGKLCNLSEIHDLLSKAGIHNDAYNIIMQGDVTRITEMTPVQRRKIIDDIAGISEFEEKKEKALEELDKVRENIEKIAAVLFEVNQRLSQLEEDKEEAIKYKKLIEEKEYYKKILETHKFKKLQSKKSRITKEIEKLEIDKDALTHKMVDLSTCIESVNKEVKEISEKIAEITGYDEISQKIMEISSEIETIKKAEKLYTNEVNKQKEELTKVNLQISELEEEVEKYASELAGLAIEEASVKSIVDDLETKMESIKLKLQKVDEKHRKLRDELLEKKEVLEQLKEERSELVRERDRLIDYVRMAEIDEESIAKKIDKSKRTLEELNALVKKRTKELDKLELKAGKTVKDRNEVDKKIFNLRNLLAEIEEKIKSLDVELAKLRAEMAALESGFSRGVDLILEAKERRALPGVYGTVAQLCQVEERFALALEVAAGNALQYIVVENEDDAVRAINYLKQIKGGRATFLPLSRMKKTFGKIKLNKDVLSYPGVVDYAVNLVKFERRFKPVFNFVFRDTLVVDRIETARKLMDVYSGRMVTLEGDLVERTGVMSGGSAEKKRGILLSRELVDKEKKIMEEITILNSKKAEVVGEIRSLELERRKLQEKVEEIGNTVRNIRSEIDSLKKKISEEEDNVKFLEEEFAKIEESKKSNVSRIKSIDSKIADINNKISKLEKEVSNLERSLKDSKIPELSKELEKLREEYSRNKEILINIEKKIETTEFRKKQVEEKLEEKRNDAKVLKKEIENLKIKIENGRKKIKELERELQALKEEEEKVGSKVKELRKRRDELLSKIRKLERDKDACKYSITAIEERIKAKKEALNNVEEELEKVNLNDVLHDEIDKLPSAEEVNSKISEIDKELSKLGEVNLKAIQEYEEVKKRRDNLLERKLNLEKEREEILDRIEKYEKMKRDAFFEAFNAINKNFSEVIKTLTDGEGELYLDKDDPFNSGLHIKVRVYGKPVQKIESLSGGEKSLIALALIFAIQMYKPAPFYAFDEIDMFLDGANVSRVAKLIKERSKDAQFIVVSLRKPTLEMADAIVGVTMGKDKSSKVTGIKIKELKAKS